MREIKKFLNYITDEETGKVYPIPAGGSVDELPVESDESEDDVDDEDDDDSDDYENLSGNFLSGIEDEEQRALLEPYVKKWDAGVTRRFQELHGQYEPYKELGDIEELRAAAELYRVLDENPQQVYEALKQALGVDTAPQGQPGQNQQTAQSAAQQNGMTDQQFAQLPPQVQQQLEQQQQILTTLAESYLNDQRTRQEQEEDAALDEYLQNLHTEFGDFDEDYVLSKMLNGMDGSKAVKAYHKAVGKASASAAKAGQPTVLSGGGSVASETVNVSQLTPNQIKELTAGLMAQAQENNY